MRAAVGGIQARSARPAGARRTVVARAAPTANNVASVRQMSDAQLDAAVKESKTEIIKLEMKKASRQEFKPHEIKAHKKQVARLLTVKREREIEQGVSKRESRRNEKNAALAKYKQQLKDSNIVIQRPKSQKLRWKKREAARAAAAEE
mmetsp:Transcript_2578/g.9485  ORF Transcript_2578/g.9485 Transcript_2578/m.9485 type:complete len:148 (+) Transcript_2578:2612-3055(+)